MKPVQLMRFAPFDLVEDEEVKLAVAERDYAAFTLYVLFICRSHLAGGTLPADPKRLAVALGMPVRDVERALARWMKPSDDGEPGKIRTDERGRLYQKRVRRDLERDLAYRQESGDLGRRGAARRWGTPSGGDNGSDRGPHSASDGPPTPTTKDQAPVPTPTPGSQATARARGPASQPEIEHARAEAKRALGEAVQATGRDPQALLAACSRTPNGRSITSLDACDSAPWLRVTAERLAGEALGAEEARRVSRREPTAAEATTDAVRRFIARGES